MTTPELYDVEHIQDELRRACEAAGGLKTFARRAGLSHRYVQCVEQGLRKPGAGIANVLGYERRVIYLKRDGKRSLDAEQKPAHG